MVPRKAFHISVAPGKAYTSTALRRHSQHSHTHTHGGGTKFSLWENCTEENLESKVSAPARMGKKET